MSRKDQDTLPPDWIQKRMVALRQQVTEPEQWPETADQLLAILAQTAQLPDTEEGDEDMLSLVVHEVLAGVDIAERYPTLYEKMLANPRMYQAFLDALDTLETDSSEALSPLPQPASRDLPFLNKSTVRPPKIDQSERGDWRITWQLLKDQLRHLLFPSPELVYRRTTPLLEDESIILLHDEIEVASRSLEVMLEAIRPVEQPEILRLQVVVAVGDDRLPGMQVRLSWGQYSKTAVLDTYGRAHFPALPLENILDKSSQLESGDLQLVLESPPT